jgi:hypothetical protein
MLCIRKCDLILRFFVVAGTIAGSLRIAPAFAGPVEVPSRPLLVRVSDHAPGSQGGMLRGIDNSWTLSTSGAGRSSDGSVQGNAMTLSTSPGERVLHLLEGERFVLDLPAVQSLQFHVPIPQPGGASTPAGKAPHATAAPAAVVAAGSAPVPGVQGIVYFEAVTAFSARVRLQGRRVLLELKPVLAGSVRAPQEAQASVPAVTTVTSAGQPAAITVEFEIGKWAGLGGGDGEASASPGARLSPAPATSDALWIRVDPDPVQR